MFPGFFSGVMESACFPFEKQIEKQTLRAL